jgi:hypothetical protein
MEGYPVFTRVDVAESERKSITVKPRGDAAVASADLIRTKRYTLNITFCFPSYEVCKKRGPQISVTASENIRILSTIHIPLDTPGSRVSLPFSFRRFAEDDEGSIRFEPSWRQETDSTEKNAIVLADLPVVFRAKIGIRKRLSLVGAVGLFGLGSSLVGLQADQIKEIWQQGQVSPNLWISVAKTLVGALLQASAALIVIRVYGKKLL